MLLNNCHWLNGAGNTYYHKEETSKTRAHRKLYSEETHLTCKKCTPTSINVQRHLRKQWYKIAGQRNEGKTLNAKLSAVAVNYENMTWHLWFLSHF